MNYLVGMLRFTRSISSKANLDSLPCLLAPSLLECHPLPKPVHNFILTTLSSSLSRLVLTSLPKSYSLNPLLWAMGRLWVPRVSLTALPPGVWLAPSVPGSVLWFLVSSPGCFAPICAIWNCGEPRGVTTPGPLCPTTYLI